MPVLTISNNGLNMEVTIEKEKGDAAFGDLVYKVYIQLFFNDSKVDIVTVPTDLFSNLLEKYVTTIRYVTDLRSRSTAQQKEKKVAFFRTLGSMKRTKEATHTNTLSDLRTINVFTIDRFANTTIGRTTIELDADIVTLLSQDVIERNKHGIVRLHICSVILVTNYLKHLMEKISCDLNKLSKAIKIASFIPFGISVYSSTLPSELIFKLLPLVIGGVITPLLFRYGTRILLRQIIGYLFRTTSS
jgi:hypothetical protein